MILYPPERVDANDWFSILSFLVTLAVCWMLPRRFSAVTVIVFSVFTVFLAQSVDSLIAVKPYDLYDVNDSSKYEIMDLFIYYLNYPTVTYLFLTIYDIWKWKGWKRLLYIMTCSGVCGGLEWLALLCHVFTYKGWKLLYSPIVYICTFTLYIIMYHTTQTMLVSAEKTDPRS